jgi:hypothetical protein
MDPGPGQLNGVTGIAKIDGEIAAEITLHDDRAPRIAPVMMAGTNRIDAKEVGVTGAVMIRFDLISGEYGQTTTAAQALKAELDRRAGRERAEYEPVLDLELSTGADIEGCRVGGYFAGIRGEHGAWFGLELPE